MPYNIDEVLEAVLEAELADEYKGFKIADLRETFNAICNPKDWRGAIDCNVLLADVVKAEAAIEFFTATIAKRRNSLEGMEYVRLTSPGYRNGPAGDH